MFSIFTKLGGEDSALDILAKANGVRPNHEAVKKWRLLGRIPAIRAVVLLDACRQRGIEASYDQDCTRTNEAA